MPYRAAHTTAVFSVFIRPYSFHAAVLLFAFVAGGLVLPELHRYEHISAAEEVCVPEGIVILDGDHAEIHECVLCDVRLIGTTPLATHASLSLLSISDQPVIAESFEAVTLRPFNGRAPPVQG